MPSRSYFATQIYQATVFKAHSAAIGSLIDESNLIRKKDRRGQEWSKANYSRGYTSYGSLDELHRFSSSFEKLGKKIDSHVYRYLRDLQLDLSPKSLKLRKMWVNIMGEACTHAFHIHPLAVISGTFYLQVPTRAAAIQFEDPRQGRFMSRPPLKSKESLRSSRRLRLGYLNFKPRAGQVLLFESWLNHQVPPHPGPHDRISVSFNYEWLGS